jgi:hypothetical protein
VNYVEALDMFYCGFQEAVCAQAHQGDDLVLVREVVDVDIVVESSNVLLLSSNLQYFSFPGYMY